MTHDDDVARRADRIIRFNDGRIAPPSEPVADAAASESTGQVATATSGDAA